MKNIFKLAMVFILIFGGAIVVPFKLKSSAQPGWRDCKNISGYTCKNKTTDGCEAERLERCVIYCREGSPIDCEEIMSGFQIIY